jgi:hypothetical protein
MAKVSYLFQVTKKHEMGFLTRGTDSEYQNEVMDGPGDGCHTNGGKKEED